MEASNSSHGAFPLTLPDLSLLVPTTLSGGGGGVGGLPLISQEPLNLEQRNFARF